MIHMGQTMSPLPKLLDLLKRGDIVTHMFAPPPNSIVDDSGHILPEVLAARRRGVWFDVGNGQTGHMRWDTVERDHEGGLLARYVLHRLERQQPDDRRHRLPNCMSKLLGYGMSVERSDRVRDASIASRTFPVFNDRGTLNVGAPADVALLELREGTFEFLDNYKGTISGKQRLFPAGTVLGGKRIATA